MQLNQEDGCNRHFILVQLPELTDEKSDARKAGFDNLCQIGEERIRRVAKKLREAQFSKSIEDGLFAQENPIILHILTILTPIPMMLTPSKRAWLSKSSPCLLANRQ